MVMSGTFARLEEIVPVLATQTAERKMRLAARQRNVEIMLCRLFA
jgi:hypothetical protein